MFFIYVNRIHVLCDLEISNAQSSTVHRDLKYGLHYTFPASVLKLKVSSIYHMCTSNVFTVLEVMKGLVLFAAIV